jgi:small-conductance mechanosensitive channel
MTLPVQVSYDSDVDQALELMVAAGAAEPRVLKEPPNAPAAFIVKFAESGIELELGVWINDPENGQGNLRSSINHTLWNSFRANGIRIPSPQRELRIVGALDAASAGSLAARPSGPTG